MPLREKSVMEQRQEFVRLAEQEGVNRRELCRRFGISADTAYRWLRRWEAGDVGLADGSRRPHHSPCQTEPEVEAAILMVREEHPAWGARKIAQRRAVGRQQRAAVDAAWGLAAQARRPVAAQPAVSSAEPWQERAAASHAEGRGGVAAAVRRSGRGAAGVRSMALYLQRRAPA